QYAAYTPRILDDSHRVNGAFTVGENIGDLGGLSIALLAYQLALNGQPAPVIDGLTGVQRVFFGLAQVERRQSRAGHAYRRVAAGMADQIACGRGDPTVGGGSALATGVSLQRRHP